MEQLILILIQAALSGVMIAIGMLVGSRLTSKSIVKELDKWMNRSEFFNELKGMISEQELIPKATVFFEEATALVSSPEAKQFFKNATAALKEFSGEPDVKIEIPKKK